MNSEFVEAVRQLEREFNMPTGFLGALLHEGDWSFVIKAHALVEGALSHLLASATMDPRLVKIFQRLETSNDVTGKLAFIKAMDLLTPHRRRFIKKLSELRNQLVHDVNQSSFEFGPYIDSLDSNQRRGFGHTFSWRVRPRDEAPMDDWNERAFEAPKQAIWINLLLLLIDASKRRAEYGKFLDEHDIP